MCWRKSSSVTARNRYVSSLYRQTSGVSSRVTVGNTRYMKTNTERYSTPSSACQSFGAFGSQDTEHLSFLRGKFRGSGIATILRQTNRHDTLVDLVDAEEYVVVALFRKNGNCLWTSCRIEFEYSPLYEASRL